MIVGVTGGSGLIGRRLIPSLIAAGHTPRLLLRSPNHPGDIAGDMTDASSVDRFIRGCEAVIHLAAIAHTKIRSKVAADRTYAVNVTGTRTLTAAAIRHGVRRLVFASSVHVYRSQAGENITEDAPRGTEHFYARTKVESEDVVQSAAKSGMEVVIARPCLVYGAGVKFNLHHLLNAIDRGMYWHLGGSGPQRSFLALTNAANAFVHLLDQGTTGEAYNVADQQAVCLVDFVNQLADLMHRPRPFTLPTPFARVALGAVSFAASMRLFPSIHDSVRKLTSSFTFSVAKLAASGFCWTPPAADLQSMVEAYRKSQQR